MKLNRRSTTAEGFADAQIALDRMLIAVLDGHAMRVAEPGKLAGVGEADAERRACGAREPAAAEQPLKIDDKVKFATAKLTSEPEQIRSGRRVPPAVRQTLSLEMNHFIKLRMTLKQSGAGRRHQPGDMRRRP